MKKQVEIEHYHSLLAPCPYTKFTKEEVPILSYEGKVLSKLKLTRVKLCRLQYPDEPHKS